MSHYSLGDRVFRREMTRRDFLWLASASGVAAALPGLSGCAVDPVTGENQVVLMSEAQERAVDREQSPHQFSEDYGVMQQRGVNAYLNKVGLDMARRSHRPQMPYSFQAVNAVYINAYTFPGGSVGVTRGILAELDNEAELAALLGHEIGHVNARHAAERATRGMLTQVALAGATIAVSGSDYGDYAGLVSSIGGIGAGALLSHYSRDDEREADALGMEYMVRSDHSPDGMVGLMDILRNQSKDKPNAIEMMFATHPMSDERYATARERAARRYAGERGRPLNRERYMDHIAAVRRMKPAIDALQKGEKEMKRDNYSVAEGYFSTALQQEPEDYAGLVMMSKCQVGLNKPDRAQHYARLAERVDPKEAQAHHLAGIASLMQQDYAGAYEEFRTYENVLPGNPNTLFLTAVSLEGARDKSAAAKAYYRYLQSVQQGDQAQHAYSQLKAWGYLR
jgi:predicted Zn-dependent protease